MAGIYRQRHPEHTVFYRVFFHYFELFLREYEDRFEKENGYFRPVIQEIFIREVLSLLLRKKLIGVPLVEKILHWCHTGFSVHSQVRAETTSEAERAGKYMIRYYGYSNAQRGEGTEGRGSTFPSPHH